MTTPDKTDWRLVLLIWAAGLGAAAQYAKISVIFEQLGGIYPDAGARLGFIVSLVGGVGIVLGVAAGVLVAWIGYRRALLWGLVAGAAVSAVQSVWPPLNLLLLTRLIEGVAHLALVVSGPTLIAQVAAERDRGLALTLWGSFFGVTYALLVWVGLPFANAWGEGALIGAHAVYMAAMALILAPLLPRSAVTERAFDLSMLARAHLRLYGSARIGAAAWGWLFYTICFLSLLTLIPPYIDESQRAFVVGAMPLMSILSSLTLGVWLLRRITAAQVVMLGFVLSAGTALALVGAPGQPTLALLLGASLGLVQGASFAAVAELNAAPEDRALANGGLAQMGNLGNTIGTPLMLWVVTMAGYAGFMAAIALVLLLGAVVHILLSARRRRAVTA
ncbi:MAG: MFS transporter [Pseudomonadota bacterium]